MRPATLPSAEVLGPRHEHGTRIRYMGGCRCLPCRAANSRYSTSRDALNRAGERNDIVSARPARVHILALSRLGIGRNTVVRVARVARSIVIGIRSGEHRNCRRQTRDRILEVDRWAIADGANIDAGPTWRNINRLLCAGWSKVAIARALGNTGTGLQVSRGLVRRSTARKIARLLHRPVQPKRSRWDLRVREFPG